MNKDELIACAAAKSDQIDADNLIGGIIMDVTIKAVQRGPSQEQPLQLVLVETEKFYRPSKTMRRALIGCFGDEPSNWIGKRIRLIRNPETMFGGVKVGGIEVSHASISAPVVLMLSAKRGKKSAVKIDVIPAAKKQEIKHEIHTPEQKAANIAKAKAAINPVIEGEVIKPNARGTISGDPEEGNLDDGLPLVTKPSKADIDKMLAVFAKIGMDADAVAKEYNKPIADWIVEDMNEARELYRELNRKFESQQISEGEI